jgi:hypothetical protein
MGELSYREDPDLTPAEKETTIRFGNDTDRLTIFSEQRSVVRWLDTHPHFEETDRRVKDGLLVGITGTLPIGCLQLKGTPRKATNPASVLGKLGDSDG